MRLWTIQHPAALALAHERGSLRGDGRRICLGSYFRGPYRWLMNQMTKRVPGYGGGYPVWAWPERPDLRRSALHARGEKAVMIECEVPRERVLLSDFMFWHLVLNNHYIALTRAEDDAWEKRYGRKLRAGDHWERSGRSGSEPPDVPERARRELETSWELIFDFPALWRSRWLGKPEPQATLEEILVPDEVVSVREFVAR